MCVRVCVHICAFIYVCMCIYDWVTLLLSRNWHNIVNQLYSNKNFKNKPNDHVPSNSIPRCTWTVKNQNRDSDACCPCSEQQCHNCQKVETPHVLLLDGSASNMWALRAEECPSALKGRTFWHMPLEGMMGMGWGQPDRAKERGCCPC